MELSNDFTAPSSPARLWPFLLDVERVVPCVPGAALTETIDDTHWKGTVDVRFGPVSLTFQGTVEMTERDDTAHRVALSAQGTEQKGRGRATATVVAWLEPGPDPDETTVQLRSDVTLVGPAAQLSRGLLPEVTRTLTERFATCLRERMSALEEPTAAGEAPLAESPRAPAIRPLGGIRLGLSALWARVRKALRRLFSPTAG